MENGSCIVENTIPHINKYYVSEIVIGKQNYLKFSVNTIHIFEGCYKYW